MSQLPGLTLYVGPAELYRPLPSQYLGAAEIVGGSQRGSNPCCRRGKQWKQHAWLVYGANFREPIDCSNKPRATL